MSELNIRMDLEEAPVSQLKIDGAIQPVTDHEDEYEERVTEEAIVPNSVQNPGIEEDESMEAVDNGESADNAPVPFEQNAALVDLSKIAYRVDPNTGEPLRPNPAPPQENEFMEIVDQDNGELAGNAPAEEAPGNQNPLEQNVAPEDERMEAGENRLPRNDPLDPLPDSAGNNKKGKCSFGTRCTITPQKHYTDYWSNCQGQNCTAKFHASCANLCAENGQFKCPLCKKMNSADGKKMWDNSISSPESSPERVDE